MGLPMGSPTFTTNIMDLPNEMLLMIFKMLPREQLVYTISSVCTRWKDLIEILWTKVVLNFEMPKELVLTWVSKAVYMKQLVISDRSDAMEILQCVTEQCQAVENISLHSCTNSRLRGNIMCDLLTYLPNLSCITVMGTRFRSCKFFCILAEPHISVCYMGGITYRELIGLLKTTEYHKEKNRVLSIKNSRGCCRINLDSELITFMLHILERKSKDTYIVIIWDGSTEMYNRYFKLQNISLNEIL